MERTNLTVRELDARNTFLGAVASASLFEAVDAAEGAALEMKGCDDRYLIVVQNAASAAKTVTVKAGNGLQGVADLSYEIAASSTTCVVLESGHYKNVSGADKGKVLITGTADIKVAVFKLP